MMLTVLSAGSVTAKESETAGQLSKDAARKDSKESSHEEQRVTFSMASDTDSLDSLDMPVRNPTNQLMPLMVDCFHNGWTG